MQREGLHDGVTKATTFYKIYLCETMLEQSVMFCDVSFQFVDDLLHQNRTYDTGQMAAWLTNRNNASFNLKQNVRPIWRKIETGTKLIQFLKSFLKSSKI